MAVLKCKKIGLLIRVNLKVYDILVVLMVFGHLWHAKALNYHFNLEEEL